MNDLFVKNDQSAGRVGGCVGLLVCCPNLSLECVIMNRDGVDEVLAAATCSLFRWEARGIYREPIAPLPRDHGAVPPVPVQRVWVVASPPTTEQRDELAHVDQFRACREDVRMMSGRFALDLDLPDYDWWLVDDQHVVTLSYDRDHVLIGGDLVTVAAEVDQYRHWRNIALAHTKAPVGP